MADFVPLYANLGKQFRDLYKKKYDFDNALKITSKTNFGLTLTTTAKIYKDQISGATKALYFDRHWGEVEGEVDAGTGKLWGKAVLRNLVRNANFTFNAGIDPTSKDPLVKDGYSAKGEVEYKMKSVSASGSVLLGDEGKGISAYTEGSIVVGFEGLSVGGQAKLNLHHPSNPIQDYNVGAQYEHKNNFVAALLTEFQGDVIRLSWWHEVSRDQQLGVEFISDDFDKLSKPSDPRRRVVAIASSFQVDPVTLVKARANNYGEVAAVVEHRLANPNVLLSAAAQFKASGSSKFAPEKFGVTVSLGE
jgi:voltage-dependent anion channel protein 2